jgi:hypothetical protein
MIRAAGSHSGGVAGAIVAAAILRNVSYST